MPTVRRMDRVYDRPPRLPAPAVPTGDVTVRAPKEVPRAAPTSAVARLLPAVLMVAMVGMMVLFVSSGAVGARNPTTLLFPLMMVVSTVGMLATATRGPRTAEVDEDRREYLAHLRALSESAVRTADLQRRALLSAHPDPASLWTLVGGPRMWERRRDDSDFAHVRVGVGTQRLATRFVPPDLGPPESLEPVSVNALRRLIHARSTVPGLPVALALGDLAVVTLRGEHAARLALVRAMVCQLAVHHSPDDVAVVVICAVQGPWDWLKWLPHHRHRDAWDDTGPGRLCYREVSSAELDVAAETRHVVVLVDGDVTGAERLAGDGRTLIDIGGDPDNEAPATGFTLSVSARDLVADGASFACPDAMSEQEALACARRLAAYRHDSADPGRAANTTWPHLLGVDDAARLNLSAAWRDRGARARLRIPIGTAVDGTPVELDLKESAEGGAGPHGLCVGATGSGKSEFLRTLALGLVATHPPALLHLVLVDFKGGATFLGLESAPHVAAVITNLAEEAPLVARMKDALAGELHRRQERLRAAGNFSDVAAYERARRSGQALAPLPALVVIVDEFSELLSRNPDFAELFVAIGRLGRSLRIHLLLASQRLDEGRLRGLEAHLSYRVCLKTFSAAESRAVIGVADAFHLPGTPGAGVQRTPTGVMKALKNPKK